MSDIGLEIYRLPVPAGAAAPEVVAAQAAATAAAAGDAVSAATTAAAGNRVAHPWRRRLGAVAVVAASALVGNMLASPEGGRDTAAAEGVVIDESAPGVDVIDAADCVRSGSEVTFYADQATGHRMAPPLEGDTLDDKVNNFVDYLADDTMGLAVWGVEAETITDVQGADQFDARIEEFGDNEAARNTAFHDLCTRLRSGTVAEGTLTGDYWTYMARPGARPEGRPEVVQTRSHKNGAPVLIFTFTVDGVTKQLIALQECRQPADKIEFTVPHLTPEETTTTTTETTIPTTTTTTTTLRRHTPATGVPPVASQPANEIPGADETRGYPERGHAEEIADSQDGDDESLDRTRHGTEVDDSEEGGRAPGGGDESVADEPSRSAPNNPGYKPGTESEGTDEGTNDDADSDRTETEGTGETSGTSTDPGMPGQTR